MTGAGARQGVEGRSLSTRRLGAWQLRGWPLVVRRELRSRCGGIKRYDVSTVSGPRHGRPLVAALLLEMMTPVSAVGLLVEETAA